MNIIQNRAFKHELVTTSRVFGRDKGLHVRFQGVEAYTDATLINLPDFDESVELTEEVERLMRSYVDHETAHVRYTEVGLMKEARKEGGTKLGATLNAFEDVRIEKCAIEDFPGAAKNLKTAANMLSAAAMERIREAAKDPSWDERQAAGLGITWAGRMETGLIDPVQARQFLDEAFTPTLRDAIERYAKLAANAANTQEEFDLARAFAKEIQLELEPEPEDEIPDNWDAQGKVGDANAVAPKPEDMMNEDRSQALKQHLQGAAGTGTTYRIWAQRGSIFWDRATQERMRAGKLRKQEYLNAWSGGSMFGDKNTGVAAYTMTRDSMSGVVPNTVRQLERILMSHMNVGWRRGLETGRIDAKRLASVAAGNVRVFRQREEEKQLDTAVQILVDLSGSMDGREIQQVFEVVTVLSECCDRLSIPLEVLGFKSVDWSDWAIGGGDGSIDPITAKDGDRHEYEQMLRIVMPVYKAFDQKLRDARADLSSILQHANGGTPTGAGMMMALPRIVMRPEKRKAMFVLTDGQPNNSRGRKATGYNEEQMMQAMVAEASKRLSKVLGIGICGHNLSAGFGKHAVSIDSPGDLAKTLADHMRDLAIAA